MADSPEPLEAGESGGSGHAQPIVLPASESGGSGDVHEAMGDAGFQAVFPAFGDSTEFGDVGGAPGENPAQVSAASDQSHASRNPTRGDIGGDDDGGANDDVIEDIIEVSLTGLRGDIGGAAGGQEAVETSEAAPPQAAEAWSRSACGGSGGSGAFEVEAPPETVASWNQSACGGSGGSGAFEAAAGSGGAPDSEHMGESHSAPGTGSMQGPAQSTPRAAPESLIGDVGGDHGPVWAAHITGGGSGGIVDSDDQEEAGLGFTCGLWPADPPSPNRLSLIAQSAQPASASGDVGPMPTSNSRPGQDLEAQGGYPAASRGVAEDFDGADSDPGSPEDSPERRAVQEAASALGFMEAAGGPGDSGACSSPSTRPQPFTFDEDELKDDNEAAGTAGESGACSSPSRPQPFTFDEDELKDEAAGTAGESGACSSPSRPQPFTFDEDELKDEAAGTAGESGACSSPSRLPAFAFDSEEEAKEEAWTAAAPVAEAGTTGESGGCSSPSARPEPFAFEDEGAEEVKEEAAGTAGESGACSSPSNRPGPEPFNFNFEDVADEAVAEAPSSSELAAGTAGETGACSSPSTRPVPLAFDEEVDEEGDPKEVPAAEGSGAFSPPEPFASFAFQDEATNAPAPVSATGNAASTGSAASPLAQPEPFAFDEDDEVQEEAKASSPPARQADLSFDDEEEAEAVEAPGLAEQCRSSSEEAGEPQSEVPAAALAQSPLSFDEDEEEDREALSRSVEDGRQSPLAFDEEDEDEKAKAAPAAETGRQSAFAFDDEDELEATAPAAAETARQSPLTFEDDDDEEEVPAAATEPARQAPLAFEDEEEAALPVETARQAPLSFGDEDEGEEEVPEASPQTSRPWASAQSEPVEPEDEDDDQFADFASAGSPPTVSQPSAPGAKDEEEEDENWAFSAAPTSPEPSAANMEELANSVQQLLSRWNEVAKLATAGLAMSLEDDGAAGEEVPGSDDWIRAAVHMPEEAAQLIQSGVSDGAVSSLPLGLFGALASPDASSLGSTVREGFFAALGKHLQLPSAKPEAATSPQTSRPSSPQTLAGVSAVPAQVVGQAAPVQPVGAEEAMADVDFGFFEVSTTPKVPAAPTQVSSSLDADVLSQALSSVGLQNTAATSTVSMTPDIALTADTGVPQVKKKKKGMTQKVKSFLSGLPDLKHLYSKSVVE